MSAVIDSQPVEVEVEVLDRAEITNGKAVVQYSRTEAALAD